MRTLFLCTLILLAGTAPAQILLPSVPTWTSVELDYNGTGLDLGDVDGDGWLDLAVSNGNDITESPNFIYHNQAGELPTAATWVSDDARYSGHCQLADVDGDGYPEFMVANYIGADWTFGQVQLYDNATGVLATTPTWESPTDVHTFRAVFGDPDGDGDLDLAVATGEAYHGYQEANLVFFNEGGVLQSTAGWRSDVLDTCYDVKFADMDLDGDQDLLFLGGGAGVVSIYFNEGGTLATTPGWTTAGTDNGNTFDVDDLDGDGRPDLLVGYNTQLGGSGRFAIYLTDGGELPTTPTWTSDFHGYGSAVVCADMDRNGAVDLVTGGWWQPVRVYLNRGGGVFATEADWQSSASWSSVVENFALADLDRSDAVAHEHTAPGGGSGLVALPRRHLQSVDAVFVDGVELSPAQYCVSLRDGWISLGETGAPGSEVSVSYQASAALDLAVSNWDDATYVFESDGLTASPDMPTVVVYALRAQPNPFNPQTAIHFRLREPVRHANLSVFDPRGRQVGQLLDGSLEAGEHIVPWSPMRLSSGVYLYRLSLDGAAVVGKVTLAR